MAIDRAKYAHVDPPQPVIHRRKPVPFSPRFTISNQTGLALQEISRLDQELNRYVLRASDFFSLVERAWGGNFHASTSLEGNPLTLPQVRQLTAETLAGERKPESSDPYRQEIINHLFAWLLPDAFAWPWSRDFVSEVHRFLMEGVDASAAPGEWTDKQMTVVDRSTKSELFFGAPAGTVIAEIEDLVSWVNGQAPAFHPVVGAALLFHEFESIHPFRDGNGRVGRVLFHAFLQNAGLRNANLCLVEQQLVADADLYYRILAWTDFRQDYTDLIAYFAESVLQSYLEARDELQSKDLLTRGMDEQRKRIIVEAKRHRTWFSAREAGKWTDGVVQATVLKHLNSLFEDGVLEREGETKSRRYRFKSPFREIQSLQRTRLDEIRARFERARQSAPNLQ